MAPEGTNKGELSAQHEGTWAEENNLAVEFGRLARELQEQTPEMMLEVIVRSALNMVPGAEDGSVSIVAGRRTVTSHVHTSDVPRILDAIQERERQGPCIDAAYNHETVRVSDLATDNRWPVFARCAVAESKIRSMLCIQLYVEGDDMGALNLYSSVSDGFTDESEQVGLLVAAHAAVALAESREIDNLRIAVTSRDLLGQAKGILMERYKITAQQAFILLVDVSSKTNTKLYEVAERLTNSGELR